MSKNIVICPVCKLETDIEDMTTLSGHEMCEGCAENTADFAYYDDPHGKHWENEDLQELEHRTIEHDTYISKSWPSISEQLGYSD